MCYKMKYESLYTCVLFNKKNKTSSITLQCSRLCLLGKYHPERKTYQIYQNRSIYKTLIYKNLLHLFKSLTSLLAD